MRGAKKQFGARDLAGLAAGVIDPITAKRGFGKANLIASWSDIVGPRYAATTRPERLHWPRDGYSAVLTVRVAGPSAVFLQHESGLFIERINSFLGYAAVGELRIVQKPIDKVGAGKAEPVVPPEAEMKSIRRTVGAIEPGDLRDALERLGTAVAADRLAGP